ncbi:MAG TPA: folylpolyglutamate synthase/dihydrofolate synthase family protein [Pirellulales bacterium]
MGSTDYERATAYLFDRINYERAPSVTYGARQFKLERMHELLERVGNPQTGMPIVHVAGTKGKGSTSAMIAGVLTAAGYRTGLFTSPHLESLEERIAVDGRACSADELVALIERLRPEVDAMDQVAARYADECGPTYFELTTVMALLSFAACGVQAAVLEVGLGGRLDSTNVCDPLVSVITSISFDHTRQLGNTLAAIAYEKAGIVKPSVPLVSGVTEDEPRRVIEQICHERDSRLIQLGRDFHYQYHPPHGVDNHPRPGRMDFSFPAAPSRSYQDVLLGLLGPHQAANAAVALATLAQLQDREWSIAEAHLRSGLAHVHSPARIEVVGRRPTIVVDAAHNVASVAALVETLETSFATQPRILIFATTQDKDVRGMMSILLPKFDVVLLTRYGNNPRGVPTEELREIARDLRADHCQTFADPASAWDAVRMLATPEHLLCVTGSFFIAAEIRAQMAMRPLAWPQHLMRPA